MPPKSRLCRLLSGSLVVALSGLILGSPLICVACQGYAAPALVTESEDAADGESQGMEFEISALSACCADFDVLTPRAYEYRAADDLTSKHAAFADLHLQRGPPGR
jgi:hypothetical protein